MSTANRTDRSAAVIHQPRTRHPLYDLPHLFITSGDINVDLKNVICSIQNNPSEERAKVLTGGLPLRKPSSDSFTLKLKALRPRAHGLLKVPQWAGIQASLHY